MDSLVSQVYCGERLCSDKMSTDFLLAIGITVYEAYRIYRGPKTAFDGYSQSAGPAFYGTIIALQVLHTQSFFHIVWCWYIFVCFTVTDTASPRIYKCYCLRLDQKGFHEGHVPASQCWTNGFR